MESNTDRSTATPGDDGTAVALAGAAGRMFVVMAFGTVIAYGVNVLLARAMGAGRYGVYAYVLTWASILILFCSMGLGLSIVRFGAAYKAKQEWGLLRGLLRRSDQLALLASITVGSLTAMVVWALSPRLSAGLCRTFWIASALLVLQAFLQLRQATLRALGHVVLGNIIVLILRPALLAAIVGVVFVANPSLIDGPVAMAANVLAVGVCLIAGVLALRRVVPGPVPQAVPGFRDCEWLAMALPVLLTSGTLLVQQRTDTVMIGAMIGTREAGIYSVVTRNATLMVFAITAVNAVLAPMISALYASGKREELQRLVTLAAWGVFAFCVPAGLVLVFGGEHILGFFGDAFRSGYRALVILAAAQLVNALSGSVGFLMTMTGHQKQAACIVGLSALLNVLLNAMLIPRFGIAGAAAATGATTVLWNVLMLVYVVGRLRINPTVFAVGRRDA